MRFDFFIGNKLFIANPLNTLFIVITMGKVGTYTMTETLRHTLPHKRIFKVHSLTEEGIRNYETFKKGKPAQNERECFNILQKNVNVRLKLITLVRDPFEREISSFFHNLEIYFPNTDSISLDLIKEKLINSPSSHNYALNWFDKEIKQRFSIDVYNHPFDKEKGYSIIKKDKVELLIIRLEDLNSTYTTALKDFLGIDCSELIIQNTADKKQYSQYYQAFKRNTIFPVPFLNKFYTSKYAKHFYSESEIQKKITLWSGGGGANNNFH